jgi:hypothetical protein
MRLNTLIKRIFYKKETSYLLNHFTVHSPDPEINREIIKHRSIQFNIVVPIATFLTCSAFAQTFLTYFIAGAGHPFLLVSSGTNMLLVVLLNWQKYYGRPGYGTYIMYLYYFVHAATVTLVYNDWIPEQLQDKKSALKFQNLLNYVITMAFPIHHWLTAFFVMTTPFVLTSYFQIRAEAAFQAEFLVFLPDEMRSRQLPTNVGSEVFKNFLLCAVFCLVQYLQNLETATLIIEKQAVQKQNQQLQSYMESQ